MPDPYVPTQPQITNSTAAYGLTQQLPGTPSSTAGNVDQYTLAPVVTGGGGSGTVTSVAATNGTIIVSGTPTVAPTIARAAISGDVTIAAASNVATVTAINGTTVPATPTTGQVLTATGGTSATWQTPSTGGTVTSVSNSDGTVVVTGTPTVAPVVSRAAISGDVTIAAASNTATVTKINGTSVPATPTTGQVLTATGGTSATWQTPATGGTVTSVSNSDGTIVVTGTATIAPVVSRAAITGDVSVAAASNAATVTGIQGHAVSSTAPTNLQVLQYQTGSTSYVPTTLSGGAVSLTAGDASIAVSPSPITGTGTIEAGTLDQIANLHPPAANWSNNSNKITSLANGSAAQDAAAFGQIPLSVFTIFSTIIASVSPAVAGTLYLLNGTGTALTLTLPTTPAPGTIIGMVRGNNTTAMTMTAPAGATINGGSSGGSIVITSGSIRAGQSLALIATSSTTWAVLGLVATDASTGLTISGAFATTSGGTITIAGLSTFNGGTNTAAAATVTTPTLGAAAQLAQTTKDSMLYIVVGTAGTLTIAIGATSGVTTTIVSGVASSIGDMYSIRLPAGWYIAVTSSTTAAWTTTAIIC